MAAFFIERIGSGEIVPLHTRRHRIIDLQTAMVIVPIAGGPILLV